MDGFSDPDAPINARIRANGIMQRYRAAVGGEGEPLETTLVDVLADFRHWCDANDIDFAEAAFRSRAHHEGEIPDTERGDVTTPTGSGSAADDEGTTVEAMTFGNDYTDAESADLTGWMRVDRSSGETVVLAIGLDREDVTTWKVP